MNIFSKAEWWFGQFKQAFVGVLASLFFYKNLKVYFSNHLTVGIPYLRKQHTVFPHPVGIVIGQKVIVGKNCKIYQNVTIGTKDTKNFESAKYPRLGNNVTIFANSVIFGDIVIGDNAVIGAGSIVYDNVPADCVVAGNPARIIKSRMPV